MAFTPSPFPQPISLEIWDRKYRLVTPNEKIRDDVTVQDTWDRIARATAFAKREVYGDPIAKPADIDHEYLNNLAILNDFNYLPAGRITAGAGSGREVTLFNCYVMGTIPDDMGGIFDMLKEAALTMQQGGGIGYDFSPIRPSGAPVKGVDADASGPLSFMDCWDAMCRTIMSAGARRGAMMATMRDDHPDILKFIKAKREKGRLNMFNMSVLASDDFMEKVIMDGDWPLKHEVAPAKPVQYETAMGQFVTEIDGRHIYEVVRARDLWDEIMENTYNHAEPGVLFVSRINKQNNLWYIEDIQSTNPCGEQPLPPYGACLLGSLNLSRFVNEPFSAVAEIDFTGIEETVKQAVRMTDAVIDISNFPLEAQQKEAKQKRRMGLGVTGLANMLLMANLTYGSQDAQRITEKVMRTMAEAAYWESIQLAREFGPCPAVTTFEQRQKFVASGYMENMPSAMKDAIMQDGIRNTHLISIAPTGTISMYAGNVSSGVEPVFAMKYNRKVLEDDGKTQVEQLVEDYGYLRLREYCEETGANIEDKMYHMVTAQTLTPEDHLVMQAAAQKWVDSSISKTINCPEDISFEDFKEVYMQAYNMGLKGCTTYRPNDTLGSVLEVVDDKPHDDDVDALASVSEIFEEQENMTLEDALGPQEPVPTVPVREKILDAQVYKLKWKNRNFYVTISNQKINGVLSPFEIFINSQDMENFQWITALTRMMSSVFRRGGDISFVVDDLKAIKDPNGGEFVEGGYQHSFIAYLGKTIQLHLNRLDETRIEYSGTYEPIIVVEPSPLISEMEEEIQAVLNKAPDNECPECGEYAMVNRGGCPVCDNCAHSKCG